jgi:hypothetical protein
MFSASAAAREPYRIVCGADPRRLEIASIAVSICFSASCVDRHVRVGMVPSAGLRTRTVALVLDVNS